MKLTEHPGGHAYIIKQADSRLVVNETTYEHSLIITADEQLMAWDVNGVDDLNDATLTPLLQGDPAVVLLGLPESSPELFTEAMAFFLVKGIGIEVMTIAAAARTYNLLISDGRRAAVGLVVS